MGGYGVDVLVMGMLLVNTHRHCKYAYLLTIASMFFISPFFQLIWCILSNWYYGCIDNYKYNLQCHGEPSKDWSKNVWLGIIISNSLGDGFFFVGHWLFAFRYFEVAEMFGREDKSIQMHEYARKITSKICYTGIAVISLNYIINDITWVLWRNEIYTTN
jgi:hypothetical protein